MPSTVLLIILVGTEVSVPTTNADVCNRYGFLEQSLSALKIYKLVEQSIFDQERCCGPH